MATSLRRIVITLVLAAVAAAPASAGFFDWFWGKNDIEVVTVTDTTPAGARLPPASPANPVYYVPVSMGFRDFGGIVAGDREPPKEQVYRTMAKVLAKYGYLPASPKHSPSLILVWSWGTMYVEHSPFSEFNLLGSQINQRQLMRFMGAYKRGMISKEPDPLMSDLLMQGLLIRSADQDLLYTLSTNDLYVVAIAAYDLAAATRKEKVLLWKTKISCPSRGFWLADTLPVMMTLAGPNIGRETAVPVAVRASEKFKPEVILGDPTVLEYLTNTPISVAEPNTHGKRPAKTPPSKGTK